MKGFGCMAAKAIAGSSLRTRSGGSPLPGPTWPDSPVVTRPNLTPMLAALDVAGLGPAHVVTGLGLAPVVTGSAWRPSWPDSTGSPS